MKTHQLKNLISNSIVRGLTALGLVFATLTTARSEPPVAGFYDRAIASPPATLAEITLIAEADQDIVDTAIALGSFETLIQYLTALGLAEDLRGYGRFTVFAPNDDAFEALSSEIKDALLGNRELLAKVLAYHVISAQTPLLVDDVTVPTTQRTLERSELEIRPTRRTLSVNGVRAIRTDIKAINGVIHEIDQVLIPADVLAEISQ
ncbi:MAG: fasciclin domain-containing protein [Cyanothece sp. SIO1E1]|nr:fasciclin domain-containing protein [Cyanothece sp. SIO1E1]